MTIETATQEVLTALESLELAVALLCDEMAAWKALTGEEPQGRLLVAALASLEFALKEQDNALAETSGGWRTQLGEASRRLRHCP